MQDDNKSHNSGFSLSGGLKALARHTLGPSVLQQELESKLSNDASLKALSENAGFNGKDAKAISDVMSPVLIDYLTTHQQELVHPAADASGKVPDPYQMVADKLYKTLKANESKINSNGNHFSDDALHALAYNVALQTTPKLADNDALKPGAVFIHNKAHYEQDAVQAVVEDKVKTLLIESVKTKAAQAILDVYNSGSVKGWVVKNAAVAAVAAKINGGAKWTQQDIDTLYQRAVELGKAPNDQQLNTIANAASASVTRVLNDSSQTAASMGKAVQDASWQAFMNLKDAINGEKDSNGNDGHKLDDDVFAQIAVGLNSAISSNPALQTNLAQAQGIFIATNDEITNPLKYAQAVVTGGQEHAGAPHPGQDVASAPKPNQVAIKYP